MEGDRRVWFVEGGLKRLLDSPTCGRLRFGEHWRIKLIHLRPADLAAIPDGT